jgi:hypothetical protein
MIVKIYFPHDKLGVLKDFSDQAKIIAPLTVCRRA